MFRSFTSLFLLLYLGGSAKGQSTSLTPSILTLQYNRLSFKGKTSPQNWNNSQDGVAVSFIKGISSRWDWSISLNGSFPDSVLKSSNAGHYLLLQPDVALRARLFNYPNWWQPYLAASIGAAVYHQQWTPLAGIGSGLQLNYKSIYLILQLQQYWPLVKTYNSYRQFSIGIGSSIGKKKFFKPQQRPSVLVINPVTTDRDNDGIVDSVDACPIDPGLTVFAGCPDKDGDGLPDHLDHCPSVKGLVRLNGCPPKDSDNDGINDEQDSCITVPGTVTYNGCPVPDTDGDGVNDDMDSCRTVPGMKENRGCPIISPALQAMVGSAAEQLYFKTGSSIIGKASFEALEKVVVILKEHPDLLMDVEGYTDNKGAAQVNMTLSWERAEAVVRYLVSRGIVSARLIAKGFGAGRPIADNTTKRGQAKNRRVMLILK